MYNLEFLPIAKQDIRNIAYHIFINLKNPSAARNLVNKFIGETQKNLLFPYGSSVYLLKEKLKYEYRIIKVNNYIMFYIIDEEKKKVIIVRVLYRKMNIHNILRNYN